MKPDKFTLNELLFAYRKVKRELYYEKDSIFIQRIVDFEDQLISNIDEILIALNNKDSEYFLIHERLGHPNFIFKNTTLNSGKLNIKYSIENLDRRLVSIENVSFRYMADVAIGFQIVSGLWLNRIGYLLDENFPHNLYGCRLKPFDEDLEDIPYYMQNHTLYKPYFSHYRKWQNDLFDAIELKASSDILVVTTDLKKYYHSINIGVLKEKVDKLIREAGIVLDSQDEFLNDLMFSMINKFNHLNNDSYKEFYKKKKLASSNHGLPLTLIASRLLSNVYLLDFDLDIIRNEKPIYYGRYVDDIIIAVKYEEGLNLKSILNKLSDHKIEGQILSSNQYPGFKLEFNEDKEVQFIFNGYKDKVELNHLKETINKNSSEWQLLPTTDNYDNIDDIDIFFSINKECDEVNSIRQSSGLILKRNKFVKEILNFEESISTSNRIIWKKRLNNFLSATYEYIFDIKNFVDLNKYLPRLFGLLIHTGNEDLFHKYYTSLTNIFDVLSNSSNINRKELEFAHDFLFKKIRENIISSSPLNRPLAEYILNKLHFEHDSLIEVKKYFNSDFHLEPYKNCYFKYEEYVTCLISNISESEQEKLKYIFLTESIINFVSENLHSSNCEIDCETCKNDCKKIFQSSAFYFYTRRISLLELSVAFKNKAIEDKYYKDFKDLAKRAYYHKFDLNFHKGIPVKSDNFSLEEKYTYIHFQETAIANNPVVCNSHFFTESGSFDATVRGFHEPDLTRHDRISDLVNQIIQISKKKKKIDYLVFHELSLPRNLYLQIADKLSRANINLITGLEYKIDRKKQTADNQLVYFLNVDNGLGGSIALYQSKNVGAIHETHEIHNKAGLKVEGIFKDKLLIKHNDFVFSGLICNDLLDIDNRVSLRGNIDCLFVIAWNPDLETYHHLIKSATLDLHCFVSLCNNKIYGDSRIRAPYKQEWKRDVQRIHGGDLDNFMVSMIDIGSLRDFQTNLVSPSEPFKPFPTGFKLANYRKKR